MSTDKTFQEALEAARPALEQLHMQFTAIMDQITAFWRDCGPLMRDFVAQCDALTEQDWMDQPISTRRTYEAYRAALEAYDKGASGL